MHKGEYQYNERLNEIVRLKRKLQDLSDEGDASKSQTSSATDLKNEIHRLERELLHEQSKIRALTDELERPLNIHRWRKLEGSDPERYDMIRKIQNLQKRLIKLNEEAAAKDVMIKEKENLYVQLKNVLARQPGPEVAEQLATYKQNLKEKQQQRRAMEQELQMYKSQMNQYKREIKDIQKEMLKLKAAWFRTMSESENANQTESDEVDTNFH